MASVQAVSEVGIHAGDGSGGYAGVFGATGGGVRWIEAGAGRDAGMACLPSFIAFGVSSGAFPHGGEDALVVNALGRQ